MKTNAFPLLTAVLAGFLFTVISCNSTQVEPSVDPTPTGELRVSAPFANQTSQFAFELAKRVTTQESPAKNIFISPLSLHVALGMLLNGAANGTAQEIQKTLKLDAQTLAEANQTYQNLMENLPYTDPKVTLTVANSLWYRNSFSVASSFQDVLKQTFKADISAQDFTSPATVANINKWASDKTNGKIPTVVDQIQPDNVLFLLNALYFKGDWKKQFKPEQTVDAPFKLASGGETTVRMMRLEDTLRHAFRSTYSAFELPYGSNKFAMTVLLPAENSTTSELLNSLSSSDWSQLQKDMRTSKFDIGLPKFTVKYGITLNSALTAMGMPTAFTDRADFTKINPAGGLLLSFIKQDTFVAVDEKGTEAAAVTTGAVTTTSVQMPTLCDRPFVFVIHEKTSGTVLFVGRIADPTKPNS